jgi:hypothetical protein
VNAHCEGCTDVSARWRRAHQMENGGGILVLIGLCMLVASVPAAIEFGEVTLVVAVAALGGTCVTWIGTAMVAVAGKRFARISAGNRHP